MKLRLQFPGRAPKAPQLQQTGVGDPQRVLLLASVQPVPQRGGQGGAGAQVRHHGLAGTLYLQLMKLIKGARQNRAPFIYFIRTLSTRVTAVRVEYTDL